MHPEFVQLLQSYRAQGTNIAAIINCCLVFLDYDCAAFSPQQPPIADESSVVVFRDEIYLGCESIFLFVSL